MASYPFTYGSKYQGHHFWAYNISEVLDATDLPKQKQFVEIIRIQFYSDLKVVVSDVKTLKPMLEMIAGRIYWFGIDFV